MSVRSWILAGMAAVAVAATATPAAAQSGSDLVLRPGDALRITVWPNAELGGDFPVEETGFVYLPFLGEVRATGIPVEELRTELRTGYSQAMQNPVVSITPLFRVGVVGAVRNQGIFPITPTDNVLDVIQLAGGFDPNANTEKVRIVREGEVVNLDAYAALNTGDMLPIEVLRLRSGDQIVVPAKSGFNAAIVFGIINSLLATALLIDRLCCRN